MSQKTQVSQKFQNNPPPVPATDITPADDAFHGSDKRKSAEWCILPSAVCPVAIPINSAAST